jgi:hypothetical protein
VNREDYFIRPHNEDALRPGIRFIKLTHQIFITRVNTYQGTSARGEERARTRVVSRCSGHLKCGKVGRLTVSTADSLADRLSDCFDFDQTPQPFKQIPAPFHAQHFLNDKSPPEGPDDDQRGEAIFLRDKFQPLQQSR